MRRLSLLFAVSLLFSPSILSGEAAFGVRLSSSSILGSLGPVNQQGAYFGYNNGGRGTLMVGFDFSSFTIDNSDETSINSIVPFLGAKYYFKGVEEDAAIPYVRAEFSKTFSRLKGLGAVLLLSEDLFDTTGVTLTEEEEQEAEDFTEDLLSPFGFNLAVGGEYFFSDEFSLGGEFGVRNSFAKADLAATDTQSAQTTKVRFHDTYIALTVNFIFR